MEHYKQSPNMIYSYISCNKQGIDLKNMNIDQRWNEDNRIPTWTFGMVNFNFDVNFIHKRNVINETDDFVLKILKDNQEIGTRKINHNGNWFKLPEQ